MEDGAEQATTFAIAFQEASGRVVVEPSYS